jgi:L-fuconolactonase
MQIIDTHIHVWNLQKAKYDWLEGDTSILNRTYTINEIETDRIQENIVSGVLVQASCNMEDTRLMLDIAKQTNWIEGVVCWLPLMDTYATQKILEEELLLNPYCKGIRHLIHDEKNAEWLLQPSVIESLKLLAKHNLTYDIVGILPQHINCALTISDKIPDLKMVFDHLNAPPIPTQEKFGTWGSLMKLAAQHNNLYAKISGLGTAAGNFENRTTEDIFPYVEFVVDHFGVEKCLCGGDWPVSSLANNYAVTWQQIKELVMDVVPNIEDQHKIFYSNAKTFYKL